MTTLQEYLNQRYHTAQAKAELKEIIIDGSPVEGFPNTLDEEETKELEGNQLNLSEYPKLETLIIDGDCLKNRLTSLDVSNCDKLITLDCSRNQLTDLDLTKCINLKTL